jgi:hypothetical protein
LADCLKAMQSRQGYDVTMDTYYEVTQKRSSREWPEIRTRIRTAKLKAAVGFGVFSPGGGEPSPVFGCLFLLSVWFPS